MVHIGLEREHIRRSPDVGKDRTRRNNVTAIFSSIQRDLPEEIASPALIGGEFSPREDVQRPVIQIWDWGPVVGNGGLSGAPHQLTGTGVKRRELAVCDSADVDKIVSCHQMATVHWDLSAPHPLPGGRIYGDERMIGANKEQAIRKGQLT